MDFWKVFKIAAVVAVILVCAGLYLLSDDTPRRSSGGNDPYSNIR